MTEQTLFSKVRNPKALKRMAELSALGHTDVEIAQMIEDEGFGKINVMTVARVVKQMSVRGTMFMKKDKDIADAFKETLKQMIKETEANVELVKRTRQMITQKLDQLGGQMDEKQMQMFMAEINNNVRTQNDSIRTMGRLLERLEVQKAEYKMSAVQASGQIMQQLEELEKSGYITIDPRFKKLNVYKDNKKKEEVKNETENEESSS